MASAPLPFQQQINDDLELLLTCLPARIVDPLRREGNFQELLEVVMDLGRVPTARYLGREVILSEAEIARADIEYVIERIGSFGQDNRAGIERTLHRISAIRNRRGTVVGLTCRVGRAVRGSIQVIDELVRSGKSCLLLGRPGVGKTTMLREVARVLADEMSKRVVIVDTSNEIGGDGDTPHPGIGRARRMQVPTPALQHEVMIEAVENHMPEVVIIDEIGRSEEAEAARTIAERGVQLIATAHGNSLENLILNPTLADLVGGIESVTLGDEEARRRGSQKQILERKAPPTFEVVVEIQSWNRVAVHPDVASTVDDMLRGRIVPPEIRWLDEAGQLRITQMPAPPTPGPLYADWDKSGSRGYGRRGYREEPATEPRTPMRQGAYPAVPRGAPYQAAPHRQSMPRAPLSHQPAPQRDSPRPKQESQAEGEAAIKRVRLYPFGVNRGRAEQVIKSEGMPVELTNDPKSADAVMTTKAHYRMRPEVVSFAEERAIPVYVLRKNTNAQIEQALAGLTGKPLKHQTASEEEESGTPEWAQPQARPERSGRPGWGERRGVEEAQAAAERILEGDENEVELAPATSYVRRLQHQMAEEQGLTSRSSGREPFRRVRLFRS